MYFPDATSPFNITLPTILAPYLSSSGLLTVSYPHPHPKLNASDIPTSFLLSGLKQESETVTVKGDTKWSVVTVST